MLVSEDRKSRDQVMDRQTSAAATKIMELHYKALKIGNFFANLLSNIYRMNSFTNEKQIPNS